MQFAVLNSMSSRCWEQGVKRKLERQDRKRIVYLSGQRLLPTRPIYLSPEALLQKQEELRELEGKGLIVVRCKENFITVDDAVALSEDSEFDVSGKRFPFTRVGDPIHPDNALTPEQEQELQMVIDVEVVDVPSEEPAEPQEIDLSSVDFVFEPLRIDPLKEKKEEAPFDEFLEEAEDKKMQATEEEERMTIKEAARYLGKSVRWVKGKIKSGELTEIPSHPGYLSFYQVSNLASEIS